MENIFINREKELAKLKEMKNKRFFLVVSGRRRIGKTALLKKAFPGAYYLFIWPNKSINWLTQELAKENNIPEFRNFRDFLSYMLDQNKNLIIDEFQNISSIDKSIYGEIQEIIDDRKFKGKSLNLAVAGSSYSLMNKVFNDVASPLYGRRTHEIRVSHLPIKDLLKWIKMPLKDFIEIWSIFEGIPYYYELIDKNKDSIGNIRELLINKNSTLQDEGNAVLSIEFGAQSKTYNTILTAISEGKTKLNEIASVFEDKTNIVIKYLETLRKEFSLVRRITPILDDIKKSKSGRYGINDNFLNFWFYYIEKNRNYIEQDRFNELESFFMSNFNSYVGKTFEKFIISLIKDNLIDEFAKFEFSKVGGQWGNFRGENGKQVYEIDICAVNEKTKEILFGECKWQEKVNSLSVLNELKDKINYVRWENEKRKESYAVFARSFSKKVGEFEGRKVYCFDLKDIEKRLKS